jgi:glucokinase
MSTQKVVAGIDIGGTKIAIGLEDLVGNQILFEKIATDVQIGPDRIIENVVKRLKQMLVESGSNLEAIGLGCPGPIDIEKGLVLSPTNLPAWDKFPLVELIEQKFEVPAILDNDANVAALGEFFFGAGKGFSDLLYVTISTGIGGAIIIDGRLRHGVGASAGEIGHTIVQPNGKLCRCGAYGCLETIASGPSIARRARELAAGEGSSLMTTLAGTIEKISPETVIEAIELGDSAASAVWEETCRFLGIGISNAITMIAPQVVVIGGGISTVGDLLMKPLRCHINRNVTMLPIEDVTIARASLGSTSGVSGALVLARQAIEVKPDRVLI